MRKTDDVFFLTLIDFLLQVFFFGLLLFTVAMALQREREESQAMEESARQQVLTLTGVSTLTELTDYLSKLVPLDRLRGTKEFLDRHGGQIEVERKLREQQERIDAMSEHIAKLEGWGKVSCISNVIVNGKMRPKSIATVTVYDDSIVLEEPAPEMMALIQGLGLKFDAVRKLGLPAFRSTFAPVVAKQPECRYFLNVVTRTQYLEPMRSVWSAFRTQ